MIFDQKNKRMLVLAPHADDEALGAGGFIAKAVEHSWEVQVGFAVISGFASAYDATVSQTSSREREAQAALDILGVSSYHTLYRGGEQHLRLDTVPIIDMIAFIESMIVAFRPSVVLVPCRGHHHQDHRALSDAAIGALRPTPDGKIPFVPTVLAYTHSSPGWGGNNYRVQPTCFIDITDQLDKKLAAIKEYQTQIFPHPHPRSVESIKSLHASLGAYCGTNYAEAFETLRFTVR